MEVNNLIDEFCILTENNKNLRIDALLNYYVKNKTVEEQKLILENYILFIRTAEVCRKTEGEVKCKIMQNIKAGSQPAFIEGYC